MDEYSIPADFLQTIVHKAADKLQIKSVICLTNPGICSREIRHNPNKEIPYKIQCGNRHAIQIPIPVIPNSSKKQA